MTGLAGYVAGTLLALGLAVQAAAAPAAVTEQPAVEGWTITPGDRGMTCLASGPSDGAASLSLAALGPGFMLLVGAPDIPQEKASYEVTLSFDGKAPSRTVALGADGLVSIRVNREEDARTIVTSSRVSLTVKRRTYEFSLRNAAAALDAVARCAGQQTLSEQSNLSPEPIPGAGAWRLEPTLPGVRGPACHARIAGDQIDTVMLLNRDGDLVLIGGHSNWATWGGRVPLQLSIDGGPPLGMEADTIENLILTSVKDPEMLRRLRAARILDWTIPTGHVRGDVTGLGVALDAVKACKAKADAK